ncbi:hypothetical protein Bbelb_436040 [Branchiostoma belcheri]|nr:hypothetical protein Bbelb_436040 [Branchiostoma belcheri]
MPPKGGGKAAKKAGKARPAGAKGKRRRKRRETFSVYIYKVLKQVHPDTGVSSKAMGIMNSFVNDIFERIAAEASRLAHYNKRSTISSREIQTAVRLLLPGELAKHAVSEGTKAVTKYTSSNQRRLSCGNHASTTWWTCQVHGLLFAKMSSDDVAKSVGRKLKYYMQIKRREDGFDLSGAYLPQQDYPPLKPRPLMLYHDERMHDRSLKHYFHSPNVKTKIQKLGPPKSPYNQREGKVRRRIDRVVTKTQFVEPLIQDFNAPHSPRGRRRSPSRRARLRPAKKVLRRSPPPTITRGEAQRLVSMATKLLVATETVDLDSLPGYHRGPTASYPEVTGGRLPTLAGGRVPQRPQSAPAKEQKKRRVKYTWDINGRRVPVEPYMHTEPGSDEDPDREPVPAEFNGMNIAVSNGSTRHIPEWLQLQMSKLDMDPRQQVRPKSAKWRRGRRTTSPRSQRPYSAHPTAYYPPVPPEMYLDLPPNSPPAGVPPYAWSPESIDMATQTMEEIGTQTDLEDSGMSTLHSGKVSSKPSVTEEVAYEVSVHTADRPAASLNPEASVFVQLHGKKGETEEAILQESKTHKMAFQKGQIDRFDIQTTDVGRLLSITVGHRHTDTDCVWYLDKVVVKRLREPAVTYEFLCKCQLSAEDNKAVMELPLNWCSTELDESDKTLSSSSSESDFSEESETESELGSRASQRSGSQKSGSLGSGSERSGSHRSSGSERSGSHKTATEKSESEAESRKSEAESGKSERSRRSEGSRKSVGSRKSEESARSNVSRISEQSRSKSSEGSGKRRGKVSEKPVKRTPSPDLDSKRKRRHKRPESRSSHSGLDDGKLDSDKEGETEREVVVRPKTARGRKVPKDSNSDAERRPSSETKGLTQLLIVHPDEEAKSDVEYSATDNDSVAVTDRSEKMSYVEPSSDSSLTDVEDEPYYQKDLPSDRDINEEQQEETPRRLVNYMSEVETEKPQVEMVHVVQQPAMAHGPPPKKAILKQVPSANLVTIVAEVHVPTPTERGVVQEEPEREETVSSEPEKTETVTSEPEGTETAPSESVRTETEQQEAEDLNEITPPTSPTIEASEGSLGSRRLSDVGETSADGEGEDKDADQQSEQNDTGEKTEGQGDEDDKQEGNIVEDAVEIGKDDKEKVDSGQQEMEDSGKGDEIKKRGENENKEETPEEAGSVFMEGFKAGLEAVRKSSMSTASPSASLASLHTEETHPKKGPTIHQAAKIGDLDRLKELATYSEELVSQMDERGWTPLHVACANGRLEVVKHLSVKTANLYKETPTGYTPMHIAAMNGHVNCMMVLHAMGCPINSRSALSQTPLHLAAMNGHPECCKWLLANRASLDAKDAMERSALELAEEYKHDTVAQLLQTCRKELERKDSSLTLLRTSGTSKDADVGQPVEESEETETWHDDKEEPPKKTEEKGKEEDSSAKDSEEGSDEDEESDKLDDALPEAVKKKEKEALLDRKRSYQEQQEKMATTNTSFLDAIRSEGTILHRYHQLILVASLGTILHSLGSQQQREPMIPVEDEKTVAWGLPALWDCTRAVEGSRWRSARPPPAEVDRVGSGLVECYRATMFTIHDLPLVTGFSLPCKVSGTDKREAHFPRRSHDIRNSTTQIVSQGVGCDNEIATKCTLRPETARNRPEMESFTERQRFPCKKSPLSPSTTIDADKFCQRREARFLNRLTGARKCVIRACRPGSKGSHFARGGLARSSVASDHVRNTSINAVQHHYESNSLFPSRHPDTTADMADTASSPKKVAKAKKPKAPAAHPPCSDMITAAITALKDRKGTSLAAIKKYVAANYKFDVEKQGHVLRRTLKRMVEKGTLTQPKGKGASGSFKISAAAQKPAKPKKKPAAKKPAAKKAKKPKKPAAKKPAAKKAKKSPKKAAKKSPKKAAKKSPAKKAKKPAAKKAKKPAAKKAKKATKKPAKK